MDNNTTELNNCNTRNTPKYSFTKQCVHCNKVIKNIKTYEHHVNTQICYSKTEITYCKICNIKLENRNEYIQHLITIVHLNNIGCNNIELLDNNQPNALLQLDPYLSVNDAKLIGTTNLGQKFTFVFNNLQTQIIDLVAHKQNINTTSNTQHTISSNTASNTASNTESNTASNTESNTASNTLIDNSIADNTIDDNTLADNSINNSINSNTIDSMNCKNISDITSILPNDTIHNKINILPIISLEPTIKQKKILLILKDVKNITDGCNILHRMIDTKLNIEDYNGLQTFIKNDINIIDELKHAYIELINKFINMLIKKCNNGDTIYKDKNISKLVISLTS